MNLPDQSEICHLHVHSEYSLVDGSIRIKELIKRVSELGQKAVAVTDHGNLFGAIEFYTKAKEKGIKPIIGAELYCSLSPATLANIEKYDQEYARPKCANLLVLAKDNAGYKNLVKVVSLGYLVAKQAPVPVVPYERLGALAPGLLAIISCNGSEFAYLVKTLRKLQGDGDLVFTGITEEAAPVYEALSQYVEYLKSSYGEESVYVELVDNNLPDQKILLPDLAAAAAHFHLPLVASANAHYLVAEDVEAHTALLAIKNDLKLSRLRQRRVNTRAYVLSTDEMLAIYKRWPEALVNTGRIAARCNVTFEFGKYYLPKFDLGTGESAEEALQRLAKEGLEKRFTLLDRHYGPSFNDIKKAEYRQRLEYESQVIINMGFPGYFLIVQDFINWAKKNGIPVGPGRGSGAGSLVAYALQITDLDPIPYNLIFERFLNPERVSMPDFDVDFCQDRRDEVIRYVTERYGKDNVAQITTFGKMLAKGALRDVGRVLDISYGKVDGVAKLIPNELGIKLKDAIEKESRIREEARRDPAIADMLELALKLEGLSRHTSVHAAGIVISDGPMEQYVPVYRSDDGSLITQFEMKNAEMVGLIKFDFLGLKTLTVLNKTIELVRAALDPDFDINEISLADKKVFELISSGNSVGVFQLETAGMQQLLPKLRPDKFEDIIAQVALFRPGPLQSGMVDDFVERKHGRQEIQYILPQLEPILKDTYGIIVYQEQVQKIAAVLANYSLGEADLLRRAMGKKKPEEMAKQKSRFVDGCKQNSIAEATAVEIFDLMAKFAEYGFNKSHSAAYGLISYQTAFMKAHFPERFMAAIMSCDLDNTDKIIRYVEECRRMRIKLLTPCVNRSSLEFTVPAPNTIDFGLAAIKGIGAGSLEALIDERKAHGPFRNLTDLAKRANLHKAGKKTLELLVQAGALDAFKLTRETLLANIGELVKSSESFHNAKAAGQALLFDDEPTAENAEVEDIFAQNLHQPPPARANEVLINERKLLGVFLSSHPIELYKEDVARFANAQLGDLLSHAGKSGLVTVGILVDFFERRTREGKKMLVLRIEDQNVQVSPALFENEYPKEMPPLYAPVVAVFKVVKGFGDFPPRVRLESLSTLEAYRKGRIKGLNISLEAVAGANGDKAALQMQALQGIKEIVGRFPGATKVNVALKYQNGKLTLNTNGCSVDLCNDFLQQIRDINSQLASGVAISYQ